MPYKVEIAENGHAALDKFFLESYDVILMDVQMPVMDGYAATSVIRQWEKERVLPPVPIIALTANAATEDIQKSQAVGFNAYLTKPISRAALLEAIYTYSKGVLA